MSESATISKLDQIARPLDTGLLSQATGVDFKAQTVSPIEQYERQMAPTDQLPVSLELSTHLLTITGLGQLLNDLRQTILGLDSIQDKTKRDPAGREVTIDKDFTRDSIERKNKNIRDKYIKTLARIQIILQAIEQTKTSNQSLPAESQQITPEATDNQADYELITNQLTAWQSLLEELAPSLVTINNYQDLLAEELAKQSNSDEEINRLQQLITGERVRTRKLNLPKAQQETDDATLAPTALGETARADLTELPSPEQLAKMAKLRARVRKVLLANTDYKHEDEVAEELLDQLTQTALVVNELRIIARMKEKGIDLIALKTQVAKIIQDAKETKNQQEKKQFSDQLIELLVPIGNLVKELFPHEDIGSPTLISAILHHEQAICAGKAEVLVTVFRLLGLSARVCDVLETTSGFTEGHVVALLDLFDHTQLIMDANYPGYLGDTAIDCYSQAQIFTYRLWTSEHSSNTRQGICDKYESDGQLVTYKTDVLNPHRLISPDSQDLTISFSQLSNHANLLKRHYQELGMDKIEAMKQAQSYYEKAMESNPNSAVVCNNRANLLMDHYQELGMDKTEAMKQAQSHYEEAIGLDPNYASAYSNYALLLKNHWQELGMEQTSALKLAQSHYEETIRLDPNCVLAYNNLASLIWNNWQLLSGFEEEWQATEEVIKLLRIGEKKAEQTNSVDHAWISFSLASCLENIGNTQEALNFYKKVLKLIENRGQKSFWTADEVRQKINELSFMVAFSWITAGADEVSPED